MVMMTEPFPRRLSVWAAFAARLAFAVTVILAPLRARYVWLARPVPQIYMDFTDFMLFAADAALLLLLVLWCLSLLFALRPIRFGPRFIWIPLIGLAGAGLLSVPFSLDRALSLYDAVRLALLFYFYLYVVNEIHSPRLVALAAALEVGAQSAFALPQFLLQHSLGFSGLGEHDLDPAVRGVSVLFDGSTRLLRAYGLAEHPNVLGGCLAFGLIVLLAVYLYGEGRYRIPVALVFLFGLLAMFVTFSRSAWLAFAVGAALLASPLVLSRAGPQLKRLALLALTGALVLAPVVWSNRYFLAARVNVDDSFERNPIETQSVQQRALLNGEALQIIAAHPLAGVGVGASPLAIKAYFSGSIDSFVPPHFVLLGIAMETGIPGAICYLALLVLPWLVLFRNRAGLLDRPLLITACALLLGITLVGFVDIYPWLLSPGRLWQWLIWGLWAAAYEKSA